MQRRAFMQLSGGLMVMGASAPLFVSKTAHALQAATGTGVGGRILVIVQLAGGNDGLNTVVPYEDPMYYKVRPTLGVRASSVLPLTAGLGLHPSLAKFKDLYSAGDLRVVQNVGYPNPNRSHFRSMEIWEAGDPSDAAPQTGWLGRYLDANCAGCETAAMSLTSPLPQSLWRDHVPVPGLPDLTTVTRIGPGGSEAARRLAALKSLYATPDEGATVEAVRGRGLNAITAAETIQAFLNKVQTTGEYPQ
ncbi:MAG: DUF1501 domain-containing protein [Actinobacteria bacterium]|nr:DUF1501 domain-containing protein [Actinomycetota bacterium]